MDWLRCIIPFSSSWSNYKKVKTAQQNQVSMQLSLEVMENLCSTIDQYIVEAKRLTAQKKADLETKRKLALTLPTQERDIFKEELRVLLRSLKRSEKDTLHLIQTKDDISVQISAIQKMTISSHVNSGLSDAIKVLNNVNLEEIESGQVVESVDDFNDKTASLKDRLTELRSALRQPDSERMQDNEDDELDIEIDKIFSGVDMMPMVSSTNPTFPRGNGGGSVGEKTSTIANSSSNTQVKRGVGVPINRPSMVSNSSNSHTNSITATPQVMNMTQKEN